MIRVVVPHVLYVLFVWDTSFAVTHANPFVTHEEQHHQGIMGCIDWVELMRITFTRRLASSQHV